MIRAAAAADLPDDGALKTPDRLRRRAGRLLSHLTTRSDRLIADGLTRADARKWHCAVLASLQEYGPAGQAELSGRSGITAATWSGC